VAATTEGHRAPRDATAPVLVFVDTEATGLDHRVHQLTEVAWIVRRPDGSEDVRRFVPEHTLEGAEAKALEITRYHELLADEPRTPDAVWLDLLLEDARGGVLVGVVPDFDARHLLQACQRAGRTPTWDHHLIDVGVLAMPLLAAAPEVPRGVASLCTSLGVPHDAAQAHGALYDALQTMRCFDRVWELLGALRAQGAPLPPPVTRPLPREDTAPPGGHPTAESDDAPAARPTASAGGVAAALEQTEAQQVEDR
jgi:DNA polymerase III epsilon subunit-like protein